MANGGLAAGLDQTPLPCRTPERRTSRTWQPAPETLMEGWLRLLERSETWDSAEVLRELRVGVGGGLRGGAGLAF